MRVNDLPEKLRKQFTVKEAQELVEINDCVFSIKDVIGGATVTTNGITRTELFAGFALIGLLSNGAAEGAVETAVAVGKLLVNELDVDRKRQRESEQNAK